MINLDPSHTDTDSPVQDELSFALQPSKSFTKQLDSAKKAQEDYEWYPTTNEILNAFGDRIASRRDTYTRDMGAFLDIGAGNGKVIAFARTLEGLCGESLFNNYYAIEKSQTHLEALPRDIFLLGVDFHKSTLLDKSVDVIFCNPPYSEFEAWAEKIITEAKERAFLYLVLPVRWENSQIIADALKSRGAEPAIVGTFNFSQAEERKARGNVHLIEINLPTGWEARGRKADPFVRFFDENFSFPERKEPSATMEEQIEEMEIVQRMNLIESLCFLYDDRMEKLRSNYQAICSLERELLDEFSIDKNSLIESLKMKLTNAKSSYWRRLFDSLDKINERLTADSRKKILSVMQSHTGLEFNRDNAYAIVMWVIKNANCYFDEQLLSVYDSLVEYANVESYASNKRVFKKNDFHYAHRNNYGEDELTHYRIRVGHRIVLEHCGGLYQDHLDSRTGLTERAADFIGDLMTIANNLGFRPDMSRRPTAQAWKDNGAREFRCTYEGRKETLFRVRAFFNGNMHFQFLPEFIHALNIQHGKLRGWINSPGEAIKELNAPATVVEKYIGYHFQLASDQLLLA